MCRLANCLNYDEAVVLVFYVRSCVC